ncbi:MAG: CcoQ/FixQ family Cbb3-type cytochrome c oxidase assembly chaperone [Bacteroidota bacterium]
MKQFLGSVTGMNGYLIFSMIIFITFFLGLLVWVFKADKKYIEEMENMPFDNNIKNDNI